MLVYTNAKRTDIRERISLLSISTVEKLRAGVHGVYSFQIICDSNLSGSSLSTAMSGQTGSNNSNYNLKKLSEKRDAINCTPSITRLVFRAKTREKAEKWIRCLLLHVSWWKEAYGGDRRLLIPPRLSQRSLRGNQYICSDKKDEDTRSSGSVSPSQDDEESVVESNSSRTIILACASFRPRVKKFPLNVNTYLTWSQSIEVDESHVVMNGDHGTIMRYNSHIEGNAVTRLIDIEDEHMNNISQCNDGRDIVSKERVRLKSNSAEVVHAMSDDVIPVHSMVRKISSKTIQKPDIYTLL